MPPLVYGEHFNGMQQARQIALKSTVDVQRTHQ